MEKLKALNGNYLIFEGINHVINESGNFYLNLNFPKEFQFLENKFSYSKYIVTNNQLIYGIQDNIIEKVNFCFSPFSKTLKFDGEAKLGSYNVSNNIWVHKNIKKNKSSI